MNVNVKLGQKVYVATKVGDTTEYREATVYVIAIDGLIYTTSPATKDHPTGWHRFRENGRNLENPHCHLETNLLAVEKALLVSSSTRDALVALAAIKSVCDPSEMATREGLDLWLDAVQCLVNNARRAVERI